MSYTTFKRGGTYVGGMLQCPPEMKDVPPHWATFFNANDIDAAARKAAELGAKVCMPPTDIPGSDASACSPPPRASPSS